MKKTAAKKGNPELIEALNAIEKEKDISKEMLLEAIENSLVAACKNEYGKADNIRVNLDRETGEFHVYQDKVVVEEVEDAMLEMSQTEAEVLFRKYMRYMTQPELVFRNLKVAMKLLTLTHSPFLVHLTRE